MANEGPGIEPANRCLGVCRRMRAARTGHFVECAHVSAKRVEVAEAGEGMHEFHGPNADAFHHNESHPKARGSSRAYTAKHHNGGGIEALLPELWAELRLEDAWRHVLLVHRLYVPHHSVQVRQPR